MTWQIFASSAPGLEPLLAEEIHHLLPADFASEHQPTSIEVLPGGVAFRGSTQTLGQALVGLGLAARLLVRVADFPVRHLNELEKTVARLPWTYWLRPDEPVQVRATAKKSKLFHTGAIQQRVLSGIARAGGPTIDLAGDASQRDLASPAARDLSPSNTEGQLTEGQGDESVCPGVLVRIERDHCTLSLDVSGQPLHRRGYRINPYQAPLREDLARALVIVSGWDRQQPLRDPCCGSGTLLIEAALWANRVPPGLGRDFALARMAISNPTALLAIKRQRVGWIEPQIGDGQLAGFDRDSGAIAAAHGNWQQWQARAAQAMQGATDSTAVVETWPAIRWPVIQWEVQDAMRLRPESADVAWVTNPPWGDRLQPNGRLVFLYQRLGELRRQSGPGSRLALITLHREFAYKTGVPLASAFLTDAGGLKVNALVEAIPVKDAPAP